VPKLFYSATNSSWSDLLAKAKVAKLRGYRWCRNGRHFMLSQVVISVNHIAAAKKRRASRDQVVRASQMKANMGSRRSFCSMSYLVFRLGNSEAVGGSELDLPMTRPGQLGSRWTTHCASGMVVEALASGFLGGAGSADGSRLQTRVI
jgi:hypothetical protein